MGIWAKWGFGLERQLFIDHKRINAEVQAERRQELYGSIDRRRRIMDRMAQGYACRHPSWVEEHDRKNVTPFPNVAEARRDDDGTRQATA